MRVSFLPPLSIGVLAFVLAGCASGHREVGSARTSLLPAALSSRWTPPANATQLVDGEPAAVFEAASRAAESLGFNLDRRNAEGGRLTAARRQSTGFDGASQATLEVTVSARAPGVVTVGVVLREVVESGGMVTSALVRDGAPYDVFFARLAEGLAAASPSP